MIRALIYVSENFGSYNLIWSNCIWFASAMCKFMKSEGPSPDTRSTTTKELVEAMAKECKFQIAWFDDSKPFDHALDVRPA